MTSGICSLCFLLAVWKAWGVVDRILRWRFQVEWLFVVVISQMVVLVDLHVGGIV